MTAAKVILKVAELSSAFHALGLADTEQLINRDGLSNEGVDREVAMNQALAELCAADQLRKAADSRYNTAKDRVDVIATKHGLTTTVESNNAINVYDGQLFRFTKKRNRESESTNLTDFITELSRLGVKQTVINEAKKKATKTKPGALYYVVTVR